MFLLIILPSRIDICKADIIPEHHLHYLLSPFLAILFNQPSVLFKRSIFHFYPALCKVIGPWLLFGLNSIFFYGLQEDSNTVINTGYNQSAKLWEVSPTTAMEHMPYPRKITSKSCATQNQALHLLMPGAR